MEWGRNIISNNKTNNKCPSLNDQYLFSSLNKKIAEMNKLTIPFMDKLFCTDKFSLSENEWFRFHWILCVIYYSYSNYTLICYQKLKF